jgi:hypothetical protein
MDEWQWQRACGRRPVALRLNRAQATTDVRVMEAKKRRGAAAKEATADAAVTGAAGVTMRERAMRP